MGEFPELITKYFELKDWHYYESGQIKFGTLEEYRDVENLDVMEARLDGDEGTYDESFSVDASGFVEDVRVPGLLRIVNSTGGIVHGLTRRCTINEWIFCSTSGSWDKSHHKKMIKGVKGYKGNSRLLCYCVFNVDKFGAAVLDCAKTHSEFAAGKFKGSVLFSSRVRYERTIKQKTIAASKHLEPDFEVTPDKYGEMLFHKNISFEVEQEYRMVLRMKAPHFAPIGAKSVFLSSDEIRNSIVDMGTL